MAGTRIFGGSQPRWPVAAAIAAAPSEAEGSGGTVQPAAVTPADDAGSDAGPQTALQPQGTARPTSWLALAGSGLGIACSCCVAIAPECSRQLYNHELLPDSGPYAASMQLVRTSLSLHGTATLAGWLSQVFLLLAAAAARRVRSVRRSHPAAVAGRFRAWGWLGVIWVIAAAATAMPLGPAVAAAVLELTATPFGPSGLGWWVVCGVAGLLLTAPWAVLGLREHLATTTTLAVALLLWAGSIGCLWLAQTDPRLPLLANAGWLCGTGLVLLAMLLAVRSSLREIAGLSPPARQRPQKRGRKREKNPAALGRRAASRPAASSGDPDSPPSPTAEPEAPPADTATRIHDSGDSDGPDRRLSKAERRRLRKLARSGRAA